MDHHDPTLPRYSTFDKPTSIVDPRWGEEEMAFSSDGSPELASSESGSSTSERDVFVPDNKSRGFVERKVSPLRSRLKAVFSGVVLAGLVCLSLLPQSRIGGYAAVSNFGSFVPFPEGLMSWVGSITDDVMVDMTWVPPDYDIVDTPSPPNEETVDLPHYFHSNGHLVVDPISYSSNSTLPHPLLILIERAKLEWQKKVRRQSTSISDAAAEYRRRYQRNPPKGYELWWEYAKANNVILVDEYDQIHRDLEPFWALETRDLRHRSKVMQVRSDTFTIRIVNGNVQLKGQYASLERARDFAALVKRFSSSIPGPDIPITFTRHDQPACQLDWYNKDRMIQLASMGDYFGPSEFVQTTDLDISNWAKGCPPHSPLRQLEIATASLAKADRLPLDYATNSSLARSFIYDHRAAMDICQHPEVMVLHGFTLASGITPDNLVPLFTFAKTNVHADILVPPLEQYSDQYDGHDPDFKKKRMNKVLWRGSTTGAEFKVGEKWKSSQRVRLNSFARGSGATRGVLVSEGNGTAREAQLDGESVNAAYWDMRFSGSPTQCDNATCELLEELIQFAPTMGLEEAYQYKYVIDVDGNGWSGRFHRLLSMKALVLKSTIFPEWYTDRIQPWLHYVPVKIDYSDLHDIVTFFRGTPDGRGAHEVLAEKIGSDGRKWARDHWRKEDTYMFRLTLEWSRLLNLDSPESQDYHG